MLAAVAPAFSTVLRVAAAVGGHAHVVGVVAHVQHSVNGAAAAVGLQVDNVVVVARGGRWGSG